MPKFKQTMNGNLRYKVEPEYMLSQFELNQLHAMPVDNLLDISAEKNKELVFISSGLKPIAGELSTGLTASRLSYFVREVLQLAVLVGRLGLSVRRVVFSPEFVFADSKTNHLKFLYLPVNGELLGYDEILFIKDLVLQTKLDGNARIRWNAWVNTLRNDGRYEKYLQTVPTPESKSTIPADDPKTVMEDGADPLFQDWQGTPQGSDTRNFWPEEPPTTNDGESVLSDFPDYASDGMDDDEAPTGLSDDQKFDAMDKSDGTFFESMSESASNMVRARLIPLAGGNPVEITNNSFKLGRSRRRADYCIENNSISNVHATIQRTGNQFSLKDNHSTNSTYVDGVKVDPDGAGTPLTNGSVIRLWKLEYRFVIL